MYIPWINNSVHTNHIMIYSLHMAYYTGYGHSCLTVFNFGMSLGKLPWTVWKNPLIFFRWSLVMLYCRSRDVYRQETVIRTYLMRQLFARWLILNLSWLKNGHGGKCLVLSFVTSTKTTTIRINLRYEVGWDIHVFSRKVIHSLQTPGMRRIHETIKFPHKSDMDGNSICWRVKSCSYEEGYQQICKRDLARRAQRCFNFEKRSRRLTT